MTDDLMPVGEVTFKDLLEDGPIMVDGLRIDTGVCITVMRRGDLFEIDASDFGVKEVYVISDHGHNVRLHTDSNGDFLRRLEVVLENYALAKARELPADEWPLIAKAFM